MSIDIGGTFTDLVAFDEETGSISNIKVQSTPRSPELGVIEALRMFLREAPPESIRMVGHATTIATNALLGQTGLDLPRTAMITTKGFRDVIEIGRQRRSEVYNLFFQRPPMLAGRRLRFEVDERVDHEGRILKSLEGTEVEGVLREVERSGAGSLAICLLNSYANPEHERLVLEAAERRLPHLHLTASSLVSNEYREYERFSTAVVNAALMPIIRTYVSGIAARLGDLGVEAPLYVMQSNGGMATGDVVVERPATIIESGPASGVLAASWLGDIVGDREVVSFDMGGTTAKAGLVHGRVPEVLSEYEVAGRIHLGRLVKGSGYPVRFPFIDLAECSAGGGTNAWVDDGGALRVGPTSSGADPGPACYGKGSLEPTITDANLLLGRLNPDGLLGGGMRIYPEKSRDSFKTICDRLAIEAEEAARSVVSIANSMMAKILRIVSVERGFDPRRFTLIAFGGAGPMHACALAEELSIGKIIVPSSPGMFSALGLLTADIFHDHVRPIMAEASDIDLDHAEACFREMGEEARATLSEEGVSPEDMRFQRQLDMRYLGQSYELTIDAREPFDEDALRSSTSAFHAKHGEVYGYSAEGEPVEVVNVRLRGIGAITKPHLRTIPQVKGTSIPKAERRAYFEETGGWEETPIYDRGSLGSGCRFEGPAIVEQFDATTVINPGWDARVDVYGNLMLGRMPR